MVHVFSFEEATLLKLGYMAMLIVRNLKGVLKIRYLMIGGAIYGGVSVKKVSHWPQFGTKIKLKPGEVGFADVMDVHR